MPITVCPLNSHPTILHYCFSGHVTAADLDQLRHDEAACFAGRDAAGWISALLDWSALETIPAQMFPHLQDLRLLCDAHVHSIVVVGANPYLRALAISLGAITSRQRVTFRATLDEALAVLGVAPAAGQQPCRC